MQKDETMVEGNIIHYDTFHVDALLQGLKYVARTCIDHNLKPKGTVRIFRRKLAPTKMVIFLFIDIIVI